MRFPHSASSHQFQPEDIPKFRKRLLQWYEKNQRALPWRIPYKEASGTATSCTIMNPNELNKRAYQVWVSEIMLQQTRVDTVVAYFNKWILKWPTVQDLAQATLEVGEFFFCCFACCFAVQIVLSPKY
jgi:A/G-specific adenine glycosylase